MFKIQKAIFVIIAILIALLIYADFVETKVYSIEIFVTEEGKITLYENSTAPVMIQEVEFVKDWEEGNYQTLFYDKIDPKTGKLTGGMIVKETGYLVKRFPYYPNAKYIEIFDNKGEKQLIIGVSKFATCNENGICELKEDEKNCPSDCKPVLSFQQPTTMEKLQILEILPLVIETSEGTYPVTLTLKGKGFSQVNEISFCWAGPDTCYDSGGPKIWKKGDKNWTNSLTIESDEKMSLKIYVLWNEPPTKEVKEWTWTVTLMNSQGETASKEFKVRYLPSGYYEYPVRKEMELQQKSTISGTTTIPTEVKEIINPSQLKLYKQKNANANYYGYPNIQIWGKNYKGFVLQFDCFDYETYKKAESNSETNFESQKKRKKSQIILDILFDIYKKSMLTPEVNFILPKKQGRLQGVLGLLDNSEFVNTGSEGDKVMIGIYGDKKLIKTFSLKVGEPPKIIDLNINGIEKLTISIENFETIYHIFEKKNIPTFYCLINGKNIPCYKIEIGFVDSLFEGE